MAASGTVNIIAQLLGLGKEMNFIDRFTLTNTPTKSHYAYKQQATGGTAEALDIGDITTIDLIVIKAVTNDMEIDTSWVSSANAELIVLEGEIAVFNPSGTVYIDNQDGVEQVTYEYIVIGR